MTPYYYNGRAWMFYMAADRLHFVYVNNEPGIRPVINLRADVTLSGAGSSTNPYTVSLST